MFNRSFLALAFAVLFSVAAQGQVVNPGVPVSGTPANNDCAKFVVSGGNVQSITTAGAGCGAAATGANPSATAGPTAVNGSSPNFMRADAAPAVQKGSNSQFGIIECDGVGIVCPSGIGALPTIANGHLIANGSGASAEAQDTAPSIWLDNAYCSTVGYVLARYVSVWTCAQSLPVRASYFGTVGDNSTNDHAALASAISAANSTNQRLEIDCGSSGCTLKNGSLLTIAPPGATPNQFEITIDPGVQVNSSCDSAAGGFVKFNGATNGMNYPTVKGGTLGSFDPGSCDHAAWEIQIVSGARARVTGVRITLGTPFSMPVMNGVLLNNSYASIDHNYIDGAGNCIEAEITSNFSVIYKNELERCSTHAYYSPNNVSGGNQAVIIAWNYIENCLDSIVDGSQDSDNWIIDNFIVGSAADASIYDITDSAIRTHISQNHDIASSGAGLIYSSGTYPVVSENVGSTCTANCSAYFIYTGAAINAQVHDNRFDGTPPTSGPYGFAATNSDYDNFINGAHWSGDVGTVLTASVGTGSAVNLSNGTAAIITAAVALTPGIWEISGSAGFLPAASTTGVSAVGIVATSASLGIAAGSPGRVDWQRSESSVAGEQYSLTIPPAAFTVTVATNYYLVEYASFSTSTLKGFGNVYAKRIQ